MTYPFDQLSALTKANLDLSLRLADIARQGSQDSVQAAATLATTLGEAARPGTSARRKAGALSEKSAGLFRDAEKIREQLVADTRAAFEAWQAAWAAAVALPDEAKATEAFTNALRFWQGIGTTAPSPEKTK